MSSNQNQAVQLKPLATFRKSTNAAYLLERGGRTFFVKCYNGDKAVERCACEQATLEVWSKHGFKVPGILETEIPELQSKPHLILDHVGQLTLQEFLQDKSVAQKEKLEGLSKIIRENRRRHELAVGLNEPRLIHADANTSNILISGQDFYTIDFETTIPADRLEESLSIEIAKFCRWAARDLGREQLPALIELLAQACRGREEWLGQIVSRTCGRRFQFFHRWRDRRRKRAKPDEVTKYDIADALQQILRR